MKLFKYTVIALSLTLASCGKSFLEVEPIGQLGKEQLFSDLNGMRDALVGSYNLTSRFFQSQYGIYGDLRGDDVQRITNGTQNYMLTDYNYTFDEEDGTGGTLAIWSTGYEAINNINNIINSAETVRKSLNGRSDDFNSYMGQSHVLRGLLFFALANVYAQHYTYTADGSHPGIPIPTVTPLPSERVPRASMKDTYAQIIADLEQGITFLENSTAKTKIYASADASRALLSRIYLYMGRYEDVIKYSSLILNDGKYKLVTTSGNGPWVSSADTLLVDVKGNTTVDYQVKPYYMMSNITYNTQGNILKASFDIETIDASRTIDLVTLLVNDTKFVDLGQYTYKMEKTGLNAGHVELELDIKDILTKSAAVYARVGLRVNGITEALYDSEPKKLK
ncbi:MAG TPA: hypothetical protein DCS36_09240 [Sphingobacterium sp.]|nr:hypothetical protein [Sphingobacterium sp.]